MKLSASFLMIENNKEKILELDKYTDYMHYDIMDASFTENSTIDIKTLIQNTKEARKPKDVHLMVVDVKKYTDFVCKMKPIYITFHLEVGNTLEYINYIKRKNIKVGLAINPDTDVKKLIPYLDKIDLVLIMSVKAGKGGQKFIDITSKIDYLRDYRKNNKLNYVIEVDGGINIDVLDKIKGVDIVVVGSYITNGDIKKNTQSIKDKMNL